MAECFSLLGCWQCCLGNFARALVGGYHEEEVGNEFALARACYNDNNPQAGQKVLSNIVNIVLPQGGDVPGNALFGCIATNPLSCCLLGECDMDGGIDEPRDGWLGVVALIGWAEPAEYTQTVHRAVEGVALFWGAQGAVVLNDVASGDPFEALCQNEASDPDGMIGLPGVEDDGLGAP